MRRKLMYVLPVLVVLVVMACSGAKGKLQSTANFTKVNALVAKDTFEIQNDWMLPLGGSQINLVTTPNHIKIEGDSIDVFLPYFGVRRMGGGYLADGGIKVKNLMENYKVITDTVKQTTHISFDTDISTERLGFTITIFANKNTLTQVVSSQRDAIGYRGSIQELTKEIP